MLVCLAGLGLVVAACGGDNSSGSVDLTNTAEIAVESLPVADSRAIGGDAPAAGPQRTAGDIVAFDSAALLTSPLNATVMNYTARQIAEPTIAAVVDTCAVLSTSAVDAIVADASRRHSFGRSPTFTATTRGAACDYRADTHRITLLVGAADQAGGTSDSEVFVPPGAGDITAAAWDENPAVQILSEDSFGVNTAYAAMAVVGDRGLRIDNTGGTGIDYSATGELFAELADAAAANVGSAPPPRSADELNAGAAVPGDPCSIWTAAELEAFLMGTPFGEPNNSSGPNSCSWDGWDRDGASLSLRIEDPDDTYNISILEPVGSSGGTYTFQSGGLPVLIVIDDIPRATLRMDMLDGSIPDDAVVALAENLFTRLTAQ